MTLSISIDKQSHNTRKKAFLSKYCSQKYWQAILKKTDSWFLQIGTSTMKRGGGGGRRDRPFLVSVNRDILKNCSVNRDCSTLRET